MNTQFLPVSTSHRSVNVPATSQTLVSLVTSLNARTKAVQVQADGGTVRYTLDGTAASSATGFVLNDGDTPLVLSRAEADAMRIAGSGKLQLCEYSE
ncbi:hypothetical protein OpiT1DRAFT_05295 [Opitutaceae bacterium TAV1]|nr:hypothetical protein OpiT1DRAFT_05295 [Opitutaceae bacterium TAV1]